MTDLEARVYVERLAVPHAVPAPECAWCGQRHSLTESCETDVSRTLPAPRHLGAYRLDAESLEIHERYAAA